MKYADNSFVSNPGSAEHILYSAKVMPDGSIQLKECGKENLHDIIQSYKDTTDIAYILAKLQSGDMSVINQKPVMYGDFTQYPKTLADALQLQIDSKNLFDRLPAEIKKKFDNDENKFFASSGSQEWFEKISPALSEDVRNAIFPPKVEDIPVDNEVKE